ncbi:MAG TPA: type III pantothenate kinase [Opitutaceae bacterium]|nr:type III pantothenate kinase [Opitutaceae bacterium]
MLLAIDIGNTHTHFGLIEPGAAALWMRHIPTATIDQVGGGMELEISKISAETTLQGIAFCSVVPGATQKLNNVFDGLGLGKKVFHLTHEKKLGVPISYPRPQEIGQDRLANAAGAKALGPIPAIVIDMGTAVTFDIVTQLGGYEGGIIAPGVEVMRRYLHEQTALLPLLDDSIDVPRAVGKSTIEAMRIGTVIGFGGMIQSLLDAVTAELSARGEPPSRVLATGGSADLLKKTLRTSFELVPDLTLRGLATAWQLNR